VRNPVADKNRRKAQKIHRRALAARRLIAPPVPEKFFAVEGIIQFDNRTPRHQNRAGSFRRDSRCKERRGGFRARGAVQADARETACPRTGTSDFEFSP